MIDTANGVAYAGVAVSAITLFSLRRNSEYVRAAVALVAVALVVGVATQFHIVTLTPTEMTLVWFLPALAAVDINCRAVPIALVGALFVVTAIAHWLFFNPWLPLLVAVITAGIVFLPFGRKEFAIGDRAIVVWMLYAFGALGLIASSVALVTAMGRKGAPYVAHVACAAAVLLLPVAALLGHMGILPWRF